MSRFNFSNVLGGAVFGGLNAFLQHNASRDGYAKANRYEVVILLPSGVTNGAFQDAGETAMSANVLANLQVIVNSTRMRHRLTEELIELGNMLHPRILTLSEVSQLIPHNYKPSPSDSLILKFELMALVEKLLDAQPDIAAQSSIYAITKSLSDLIDEMQGEAVPIEKILNLNVSDLSGHWKRSQLFLNIIK